MQRVAHRMAADYPDAVIKVMLLDIAPTYDIFGKADATLALAFFHWFFLAQPYPFPEQMSTSQAHLSTPPIPRILRSSSAP